jgi:hypothetical protein
MAQVSSTTGGKGVNHRLGLSRAIKAVESGNAAALMAAKLDRISRSVLDTASMMEQTRHSGWELVTCDLAIDTSAPAGEASASTMAVFSQLERRLISQRTREALAVKKAQGIRLGRPAKLPRAVVARIVDARRAGNSLRAIAHVLTADGVATAQGGAKWHASSVKAVLEGQDATSLRVSLKANSEAHFLAAVYRSNAQYRIFENVTGSEDRAAPRSHRGWLIRGLLA